MHHNTDVWGDAVPVDNGTMTSVWPMGGAWLSLHLMEHYRFNGDKVKFLESTALPLLEEVAAFYYCYLFESGGYYYYSTGPSLSPENSFVTQDDQKVADQSEATDIAPTVDNGILTEVFRAILNAGDALGIDGSDERMSQASEYLNKTRPPQISESLGSIMEWRRDYEEPEPGHRHVSHLFGFHPGGSMSMGQTPDLAGAGVVRLLPALSAAGEIPKGSVSGLMARGGFRVSIGWEDGRLKEATIQSKLGHRLALRVANETSFKVDGEAYSGAVETTAGQELIVAL